MRRSLVVGIAVVLASFLSAVSATQSASAQEVILYSFNGNVPSDGNEPVGPLVFDGSGNLYGTTSNGGIYGWGTVFKLTSGSDGWSQTSLISFNGIGAAWPTSPLTFDSSGNLYGTTWFGGVLNDGTAFELTPSSSGPWNETSLHDFSPHGHDGTFPRSGIIFDKLGNAYGTTTGGGLYGNGTVFQLSPLPGGGWKENILHNFHDTDGWQPTPGLVMDSAGNLYGTTGFGGLSSACNSGCGVAFEVSPTPQGGWKEKVIFNFSNSSGSSPFTPLSIDSTGNLYGMTTGGGRYGLGGVFELSRATGTWKLTILHNFNSSGDGNNGSGALAFDAAGNIYGATGYGGTYGVGTVFELSPQANGQWKETILHNFNSAGGDGYSPGSGPILDSSGNLYGTTENGGAYNNGAVYEIVR